MVKVLLLCACMTEVLAWALSLGKPFRVGRRLMQAGSKHGHICDHYCINNRSTNTEFADT